jgi:hypothetical protein
MGSIPHHGDPRPAGQEANEMGRVDTDMEGSSRALYTADNAHVHEAMNSASWERRGLLQRLVRRPK